VVVRVWPREGVADPQGATIERSLPALGFGQVFQVRTGKCFSFVVEADDEAGAESQAADLCDRFLTNPVIEQYDLALSATVAPVP
jgi:phosphoribosylformylglycinamidine synthase subunit PurS